jgi:hypothetical protein
MLDSWPHNKVQLGKNTHELTEYGNLKLSEIRKDITEAESLIQDIRSPDIKRELTNQLEALRQDYNNYVAAHLQLSWLGTSNYIGTNIPIKPQLIDSAIGTNVEINQQNHLEEQNKNLMIKILGIAEDLDGFITVFASNPVGVGGEISLEQLQRRENQYKGLARSINQINDLLLKLTDSQSVLECLNKINSLTNSYNQIVEQINVILNYHQKQGNYLEFKFQTLEASNYQEILQQIGILQATLLENKISEAKLELYSQAMEEQFDFIYPGGFVNGFVRIISKKFGHNYLDTQGRVLIDSNNFSFEIIRCFDFKKQNTAMIRAQIGTSDPDNKPITNLFKIDNQGKILKQFIDPSLLLEEEIMSLNTLG